jgi:hypothetical protein
LGFPKLEIIKPGIVKESSMLSLAKALKTGQLQEFIAQEEARGRLNIAFRI